MRIVILTLGLLAVLVSCNESDSGNNCLDAKTITTILNPGHELAVSGFKLVYSDDHHKIYLSKYLTPNGDLIRDYLAFFIVKNDNTVFSNYPLEASDNPENLTLSFDPAGFYSEGSLRVSNNCDSLFFTDSMDSFGLTWAPHYTANTEEGSYKVNLKLKLDDNTLVDINTTTVVLKSFYPKD